MAKSLFRFLVALAAWNLPHTAGAQFIPPAITPQAAAELAAKNYVPPRMDPQELERLARQPNFQGEWAMTGSTVFDPQNVFVPYELPKGVQEFGPRPGTYLTKIPLTPVYLAQYRAAIADQIAGQSKDTYAACTPYGMPRFMGGAGPGFDLMQGADLIVMHNWYGNETRRIFLDGRTPPTTDPVGGDILHTHSGYSVGHWDGNVLVINTTNMLAGIYDETEAPHSDQVHLTEHVRLLDKDILEVQMTIDDPIMFSEPWKVTRHFRRGGMRLVQNAPMQTRTFHDLFDRPCQETIDMSKGYQSLILPQEIEAREKAEAGKKAAGSDESR